MDASSLDDLQWDDRFLRELPTDPDRSNHSRQVYGAVASLVDPTAVGNPIIRSVSTELASTMGLTDAILASSGTAAVFGGNALATGMRPYAACYGGHQFGNWAGQLGDGRAMTLGELVVDERRRFEVQLKGAGPTPYSRHADGRAVLRSSIREFLCSEAMHHLGVPTTRALTLVTTGDDVIRDMFYNGNAAPEPGAIVSRVAESFIRFGSFQIHAARNDIETLKALTTFTIEHHFPELAPFSKDAVLALIREVAERTARLMADWMRVGFVHGVMNTDNMSILGLTIDYGPYGWIDNYDPDWTPNTTDAGMRRYRFGLQPQIGGWNVVRLAEALYPLVDDMEAVQEAIGVYEPAWASASDAMIAQKMGLEGHTGDADQQLWLDLTGLLQRAETDMTLFFRGLANVTAESADPFECVSESFYAAPADSLRSAWRVWLVRYLSRVAKDGRTDAERKVAMDAVNPWFVLRNYLAQEAIELAEAGDFSRVEALLDASRTPYVNQSDRNHFGQKRPDWARTKPGCSMLSCSS